MSRWPIRHFDTVCALATLAEQAARLHLKRSLPISLASSNTSSASPRHRRQQALGTASPSLSSHPPLCAVVNSSPHSRHPSRPATSAVIPHSTISIGNEPAGIDRAVESSAADDHRNNSERAAETVAMTDEVARAGLAIDRESRVTERPVALKASKVPSSRLARLFQYGSQQKLHRSGHVRILTLAKAWQQGWA